MCIGVSRHAALSRRARARFSARSLTMRAVTGSAAIPSTDTAARPRSTTYRMGVMPSVRRMVSCLLGVLCGCRRSKARSCAGVIRQFWCQPRTLQSEHESGRRSEVDSDRRVSNGQQRSHGHVNERGEGSLRARGCLGCLATHCTNDRRPRLAPSVGWSAVYVFVALGVGAVEVFASVLECVRPADGFVAERDLVTDDAGYASDLYASERVNLVSRRHHPHTRGRLVSQKYRVPVRHALLHAR